MLVLIIQPWENLDAIITLEIWVDDMSQSPHEFWEITYTNLGQTDGIPLAVIGGSEIRLFDDHPLLWDRDIYYSITGMAALRIDGVEVKVCLKRIHEREGLPAEEARADKVQIEGKASVLESGVGLRLLGFVACLREIERTVHVRVGVGEEPLGPRLIGGGEFRAQVGPDGFFGGALAGTSVEEKVVAHGRVQFRIFIKDRVKRKIIPAIELSDYKIPEEEADAIYLTYEEIGRLFNLDLSDTLDVRI